jgi:DNA-binding MarR family transcriptional regulator
LAAIAEHGRPAAARTCMDGHYLKGGIGPGYKGRSIDQRFDEADPRLDPESETMTERSYKSDLSTDEKVLMAIVRLAETFKRSHSDVFRSYGLSFPQYNVLRVLEASDKGRNRISMVSRIMLVPGANITGIAKRLAKDGFILKKPDPKDDRVTVLEITPKGKRTLRQIEKEKDARLQQMLSMLSRSEKADLLDKIKRILKSGMSFSR